MRAQSVSLRRSVGVALYLGATLLAASPAAAEGEEGASAQSDPAAPSLPEIDAALAALEADARLDESVRAVLRREYGQAKEALQAAEAFAERSREYREAIRSGPRRVESLIEQARALEATGPSDVDPSLPTPALQAQLESRRIGLSDLAQKRAQADRQLATLRSRPVQITERIPEVEKELSALRAQLGGSADVEVDPSPSAGARQALLRARLARAIQEREMLDAERLSQSIREELLKAEVQLLQAQSVQGQAVVAGLEAVVTARLATTADRLRAAVAQVRASGVRTSSQAQARWTHTLDLADELDDAVADRRRVEKAQEDVAARLKSLLEDYESVRSQLELGLGGRPVVQLVFALDRRCVREPRELDRLEVPALETVRVAALRLRGRDQDRSQPEAEGAAPRPEPVEELEAARRAGLEELQRQYGGLIRALAALEHEKQRFRDEADRIRDYVAQQQFGFGLRSSPPLGIDTFRDLPTALIWLAGRSVDLARLGRSIVTRGLASSLLILVALAVLIGLRSRWLAALEHAAARVRRASTDRYADTLLALGVSFFLALPWPLLLIWLRATIGQTPDLSDWMWGLHAGLRRGAWLVFTVCFASAVLRPSGLALAHFKWSPVRVEIWRRTLMTVAWVYVPAMVLTISCAFGDASLHFDSLGRLAFMVAHAWAAVVLSRSLVRSARRDSDTEEARPSPPPGPALGWLLAVGAAALLVLAAFGYVITALMLSLGLVASSSVVLIGAILHGLTLRWFWVRRRAWAIRERLQRDRAKESSQEVAPPEAAEGAPPVDLGEEELDLGTVTDQIRNLLRSLYTMAVVVGVVAFWSTAFPLVDLAESTPIIPLAGITLLKAAQVGLIIFLTTTLARNLPGLLELTVFRPAQVLPGTRIAFSTLGQYAIIALGAASALQVLTVDWAQFGWIAAALSVGLGFGLQEIVANFVSGLILLFERPIRVGDIVTVEGTTGTVTRIQMRSTTVVNWDSQEFVVPNKTLVTNTLLNWTLSSSVNRIVIEVGIAYGSDVDRALQLLLDIAAAHPNVLHEPAPMATFEKFGDSTLNLILRAHLPDLSDRLTTISTLHIEIHRRFAEAGIEIAFPQRDLHLRTGWEHLR